MSATTGDPAAPPDVAVMGGLYGRGIIGAKGAIDRAWVGRLREDIDALFAAALARPGGAVGVSRQEEVGPPHLPRRPLAFSDELLER